jgi:DNA repair protein RadD
LKLIRALKAVTPDLRIVGLTATAFRLDSGRLDRGKDRVFEDIVYEARLRDLIAAGYLAPLSCKATRQKLDVTGVGKRAGDYIPGELEIAVDRDWITKSAVDEIVHWGAERRAWLVFCAGVKHAGHVTGELNDRGIDARAVTGDMPKAARDQIIADFRTGRIRCLVSVMVLGTGFNVPQVDLIALLRPTQSPGLFVQQVGRGSRNAQGKTECLVLDFSGNTARHGPIDMIDGRVQRERAHGAEAPVKVCPECAEIVLLSCMLCPACGYAWPKPLVKHEAIADGTNPILARPMWIEVKSMSCTRHKKKGSPDSLCIEYFATLKTYRKWLCLEHQGYARDKARAWWRRHTPANAPDTVTEALFRQHELVRPTHIKIVPSGRYFDVIELRFSA